MISKYYNLETLTFSRKMHVTRLPLISSTDDTSKSVAGGSPEPDAGVTPHGSAVFDSDGRRLFRPLDMAHEIITEIWLSMWKLFPHIMHAILRYQDYTESRRVTILGHTIWLNRHATNRDVWQSNCRYFANMFWRTWPLDLYRWIPFKRKQALSCQLIFT